MWKPIEKYRPGVDPEEILVCELGDSYPRIASYEDHAGTAMFRCNGYGSLCYPDYWQSLPEPPKQSHRIAES